MQHHRLIRELLVQLGMARAECAQLRDDLCAAQEATDEAEGRVYTAIHMAQEAARRADQAASKAREAHEQAERDAYDREHALRSLERAREDGDTWAIDSAMRRLRRL